MKDGSVILIHGMWSTGRTLSAFREHLEAIGYSVYLPNLPCHEDEIQDSESQVANLSILDYTTHLRDYINGLNLEDPPILMGHSMGGLLAQKLSAELKVQALVLLCPAQPSTRQQSQLSPTTGGTANESQRAQHHPSP